MPLRLPWQPNQFAPRVGMVVRPLPEPSRCTSLLWPSSRLAAREMALGQRRAGDGTIHSDQGSSSRPWPSATAAERRACGRPRKQVIPSPKAALIDPAEDDVLAYMNFPAAHRAKLHSMEPVEYFTGEIGRKTDAVSVVPTEAAFLTLIGALLLSRSEEWATQRARRTNLEAVAAVSDAAPVRPSAVPA